jgi:hypothetical protein
MASQSHAVPAADRLDRCTTQGRARRRARAVPAGGIRLLAPLPRDGGPPGLQRLRGAADGPSGRRQVGPRGPGGRHHGTSRQGCARPGGPRLGRQRTRARVRRQHGRHGGSGEARSAPDQLRHGGPRATRAGRAAAAHAGRISRSPAQDVGTPAAGCPPPSSGPPRPPPQQLRIGALHQPAVPGPRPPPPLSCRSWPCC